MKQKKCGECNGKIIGAESYINKRTLCKNCYSRLRYRRRCENNRLKLINRTQLNSMEV